MTTPNCEEVIRRLFEYLDQELDDDSQREIDRHLEVCRGCFSRAEFERRLRARLAASTQIAAPQRLRQRIRLLIAGF